MLESAQLRWLLVGIFVVGAACSRGGSGNATDESASGVTRGNDASIERVQRAARALAEPGPTVDYVAAEMQGAIKARTKSQAVIFYDGYRAILTTSAGQVTAITFDLVEAKPTIAQLSVAFGTPEEVTKGMLYRYEAHATGGTILILAEPVSLPGGEDSLVRRIVLEGAETR